MKEEDPDTTVNPYNQIGDDRYKYENSQFPKNDYVPQRAPRKPFWTRKRLLALALSIACALVALAVSLASLLIPRRSGDSITTINIGNSTIWQPRVGATWNYQINGAILQKPTGKYDVWDIDLFDNNVTTISALQTAGSSVVCYFSGGSYENWRPDAANFPKSDLGKGLSGWDGENWINISSPAIRKIMVTRLDLAVQKGCNGVDPDNVDGYNNDNGLGLTPNDSINYINFLADAAHQRNLSIGLKNAGEIVPQVVNTVQYSVNEACVAYDECATFAPFIKASKPVFHVEYPKGPDVNNNLAVSSANKTTVCHAKGEDKFSTIIKNQNLDAWIEVC